MYRRLPLFASCLALLAIGCLGSSSPPFTGKGPVPLSATNPFIGPNYYVGQQLSQGRFLRELFLLRGGPEAIEVVDSDSLHLYYLGHRQTYYADRIRGYGDNPEWVVRGPFVMSRRQFLNLKKLGIYSGAAPVFAINGRLTNFRIPPTPTAVPTAVPLMMPHPRPVRVRRAPARRSPRVVINAPGALSTGSYSKTGTTISADATPNSDQRALRAARPTAISINLLEQVLKGDPSLTPEPTAESAKAPAEPTRETPVAAEPSPTPTPSS